MSLSTKSTGDFSGSETDPSKLRVVIQCFGSRGDVQPHVALGVAMKKRGHEVCIFGSANHGPLAESMGLSFYALFEDFEHSIRTHADCLESMQNGNLQGFIRYFTSDELRQLRAEQIGPYMKNLREFQPDIILSGVGATYFGEIARHCLKIPVIGSRLSSAPIDGSRSPWGLPHLPFGMSKLLINFLEKSAYDADLKLDKIACEVTGRRLYGKVVTRKNWSGSWQVPPRDFDLLAMSPQLCEVLYPGQHENVVPTGAWVLQSAAQTAEAKKGNANFGSAESLKNLEGFLQTHGAPVYMGWGSMVSGTPTEMTRFALKTLKLLDHPGIILGGFARLSPDLLGGDRSDEELLKFASEKVLFLPTAPHEALFPRCACLVHHGGAGTLNAALRSGVPSVITPVFFDQFDHAFLIEKLGSGKGTQQLQKITAEQLARTVESVLSDEKVRARAKEVAQEETRLNGIETAVGLVEKFVSDKVRTGEWVRSLEEEEKERQRREKEPLTERLTRVSGGLQGAFAVVAVFVSLLLFFALQAGQTPFA
uniref:Uncharacterized protein n=1 Tax=Chromera velia CCMP2878 TaxID=1169474 RepID=A0A0G4GGN2_9ALVE|eukprot:Cvel_21818.t1-p1 / transcript=Cvel_21818.t1 / gene=Cvel_21818 / organism=Chromera_velia_CCMP2878 / gene_product=UDP-sugar-dependent glycosyltransferase 52, putative / transcript_product=UDP-sugar-dependent glycosyltransferase 52, putative / location=Cvel_scaffold2081:2067-4209(-) / protein_length=536 / sequence_SO=supercontig / SO=protein_coding / is_pseudo=false